MAVANGIHVFLVENECKVVSQDAEVTDEERGQWLDEARSEKDTFVDPANFGEVLKAAISVAAGGASEEPARVHFLQALLEKAAERKAKLEAEKKEKKAKRAAEAKNGSAAEQLKNVSEQLKNASENVSEPPHSEEELKVLEEIRQAKDR